MNYFRNISIPNRDLHLTAAPDIDTIAHSTTQGVAYSGENRYNAEYLYQNLKAQGILIRYFKQPQLEDKLRITVGTNEQNKALVKTLTQLLL